MEAPGAGEVSCRTHLRRLRSAFTSHCEVIGEKLDAGPSRYAFEDIRLIDIGRPAD